MLGLVGERPSSAAGAATLTWRHATPVCGPGQLERLVRPKPSILGQETVSRPSYLRLRGSSTVL
jgi:hypothetical protein